MDTTTTETTREDFLALFTSKAAAVEFENSCLSIGREFLSPAALLVLEGAKPTTAYWQWLIDQIEPE